jgi:sugar O-acyltransferase (sialic acid O-acetyltransferase NeuD family)
MAVFGIAGAGGCAREIMPLVAKSRFEEPVEAVYFVVPEDSSELVNGFPQISERRFLSLPGRRFFAVGIANSRIRQRVAQTYEAAGCEPVNIFAPDMIRYENVQIGPGAVFCPHTMATTNLRIGRFFQANMYSYVAHDCVIGDYVTFAPGVRCNGSVTIGDHAFVGSGAVLRDGTTDKPLQIGAGAIIGMGAVVTRDVPPNTTVVGNPARPITRHARS